jgi:hypothetical protein
MDESPPIVVLMTKRISGVGPSGVVGRWKVGGFSCEFVGAGEFTLLALSADVGGFGGVWCRS